MAQKKTPSGSKDGSSRKKARGLESSERYTKAVETFERGLKAFHKGEIEKAREQFESIVSGFPEEIELVDRARTYLNVCVQKERTTRRNSPNDLESLVAYGIFLHNQRDYKGAIDNLVKAAEIDPKSDHIHYCLAASYARSGDARGATRHLKRAINADPYNRVLALSDTDFDAIRNDAVITQMLSGEPSSMTP